MQYFRSRGFRDDIIKKFQLGFALTQRTALFDEAVKQGYNPKFLVATGLCFKVDKNEAGNKSGEDKYLDRFSGRAIFPWLSVSGKVVAFGGRVLDSRTKGVNQKYVNSPDSEIYHKERELYGLYQQKSDSQGRLRIHGGGIYRCHLHAPVWHRKCGGQLGYRPQCASDSPVASLHQQYRVAL